MRLTELVAPALAGGHAADMVLNTAARIRAPFAVADAGERQASVAAAMRGLLDTAMRDDDRRYLLDMCLWRYTEFDKNRHKFATRYRTATVLGPVPVEVNHEHVVERRWLLDRITSHPDKLDGYLQLAVACIVSRAEHIRLTGGVGFGWERYALAGVEVVDTVTMRPLDLDAAVTEQRRVLEMLDEQIPASPAAAVPPPPRPAPAVATATSQPPVLDGDVVAAPSVAEDDTDIAAVRALSGRSGRRRGVHLAVDAALRAAGYRRTLPGGTGGATYVSYVDPASGRNFVNLTATVAHLMRQDLRPALAGVPGVRLTGRYPQVHLDAPDAVETLQLLAVQFKR